MATPTVIAPNGQSYNFPDAGAAQRFETAIQVANGTVEVGKPQPRAARTLFDIEEHLAAMADTMEVVQEGAEEAFLADFSQALTTAVEKRDRVHQFMAHLEVQRDFAIAEAKRLQERASFYQRAFDRMEKYVILVVKSLGKDAKSKWKKLEGKTVTFGLRGCPPSVEIGDEAAVPAKYKTVSVTLPAELWDLTLDSLDLELRGKVVDAVKRPGSAVSKTAVKEAIQSLVPAWKDELEDVGRVFAADVPGAALVAGGVSLMRK